MTNLKTKILTVVAACGLVLTGCGNNPSASLSKIDVESPKVEYFVGDSFVAPTVIATYSNNVQKYVVPSSDLTFSGYDMNTASTQTVVVSYVEKAVTVTTNYSITVKALAVTGLTATYTGGTLEYGEAINERDLKVVATFTNGTKQTITSDKYTLIADTETYGLVTCYVNYGGKQASFEVFVNKQHLDPAYAPLEQEMERVVPLMWGEEAVLGYNYMWVEEYEMALTYMAQPAGELSPLNALMLLDEQLFFGYFPLIQGMEGQFSDTGDFYVGSIYVSLDKVLEITTMLYEDDQYAGYYDYEVRVSYNLEYVEFPEEEVAYYAEGLSGTTDKVVPFDAFIYEVNDSYLSSYGLVIVLGLGCEDITKQYAATLKSLGWTVYVGIHTFADCNMGAISPDGNLQVDFGYDPTEEMFLLVVGAADCTVTSPMKNFRILSGGECDVPEVKGQAYSQSNSLYWYFYGIFYIDVYTYEDPTLTFETELLARGFTLITIPEEAAYYSTTAAVSPNQIYLLEYGYLDGIFSVWMEDNQFYVNEFPQEVLTEYIQAIVNPDYVGPFLPVPARDYWSVTTDEEGTGVFLYSFGTTQLQFDAYMLALAASREYKAALYYDVPIFIKDDDGIAFMWEYDAEEELLSILIFEEPILDWPTLEVAAMVEGLVPGTKTTIPAFEGAYEYVVVDASKSGYGAIDVYCKEETDRAAYVEILEDEGWVFDSTDEYGYDWYIQPDVQDIAIEVSQYLPTYGCFEIYVETLSLTTIWPATLIRAMLPEGTKEQVPAYEGTTVEEFAPYSERSGSGVVLLTEEAQLSVLVEYQYTLTQAGYTLDMDKAAEAGVDAYFISPKGEIEIALFVNDYGLVVEFVSGSAPKGLEADLLEMFELCEFKTDGISTFLAALADKGCEYEYTYDYDSYGYPEMIITIQGNLRNAGFALGESTGGELYSYGSNHKEYDNYDYSGDPYIYCTCLDVSYDATEGITEIWIYFY